MSALNVPAVTINDATILTIASGVVTQTQEFHKLAAQTGTTDDLDTVTPLNESTTLVTYRPKLIIMADTGDTITVKHNTGNISLAGAAHIALTGENVLVLFYNGSKWVDNKGGAGAAGEANTASNAGAGGIGVFNGKVGVDLELRNLISDGSTIAVTLDAGNKEVNLEVINTPIMPGGRLTLTSATPVTTADVTGTTLYYAIHNHNQIPLYDGTDWVPMTFAETSITNAGLADATNYDVFGYNNAGTFALNLTAWTNATTRATALVRQDGIWCKTGALTYRYLGTVRIFDDGGTLKFADVGTGGVGAGVMAKRYVYNAYNQVKRPIFIYDSTTSWTYATLAWRSLDNNALNRVGVVTGLNDNPVSLSHSLSAYTQGAYGGIGVDATNANSAHIRAYSPGSYVFADSEYLGYVGIGFHYLQLLEYAGAATATIFGDANVPDVWQNGGIGHVWA